MKSAPTRYERSFSGRNSVAEEVKQARARLLSALKTPVFSRCCDLADQGHRAGCEGQDVDFLVARLMAAEKARAVAEARESTLWELSGMLTRESVDEIGTRARAVLIETPSELLVAIREAVAVLTSMSEDRAGDSSFLQRIDSTIASFAKFGLVKGAQK